MNGILRWGISGVIACSILLAGCDSGSHNSYDTSTTTSADATTATFHLPFPIVDTMQDRCFSESGAVIACPKRGDRLHGQDAQYPKRPSAYKDNGDGTVADLNTDLVWQKTPDNRRYQYVDAQPYCETLNLGGRTNWRLPTIKELYSLSDFRGELVKGGAIGSTPYIDTEYFDFKYPGGGRAYAGQYWSSTLYVKGPVIDYQKQGAFGFNFSDGHIKAYPTGREFGESRAAEQEQVDDVRSGSPGAYVRCISGEAGRYGVNHFTNNGNGSVSDRATNRMWQKADDGVRRQWADALAYCEALSLAGHEDWRLPNTKELQSIVDYAALEIPAIDEAVFEITNDSDRSDFWTSTTFGDFKNHANTVSFGKALGRAPGVEKYTDWHGAGAQRSAVKSITDPENKGEERCSENACDYTSPKNLSRCVRFDFVE